MDYPEIYTQVMTCGHAANGYRTMPDGEILSACVICSCTTLAPDQPDLTDRMARCTYYGTAPSPRLRNQGYCPTRTKEDRTCRCEKPSSNNLWFFEYRGPGGSAEKKCAVCRYYAVAHEEINPYTNRPRMKQCAHEFVPGPPDEFDQFYCSCHGDD
jgi:hypothetical protein